MTKDAIDQIFNRAQQGDVTAMALVWQMFLEGRYIKEDRTKAIHFLRKTAECNCLSTCDLLQDELSNPFVPNGLQSHVGQITPKSNAKIDEALYGVLFEHQQ